MSERAWIILDLRVHGAWSDNGAPPHAAWRGLRDAVTAAPEHELLSWSHSGEQAVLYVVTGDRDALLVLAGEHAPSAGVAAFVAMVWDVDPRSADAEPRVVTLTEPQPVWPRPGYGNNLLKHGHVDQSVISPH